MSEQKPFGADDFAENPEPRCPCLLLLVFAVGVRGANMEILGQISVREPLLLQGLRFRSLFQWLSNSMRSVSRSTPGDQVPLKNPKEGPEGWAQI